MENMDTTISPRTDFFAYANGGWIKRNAIPKSESYWGIGNLIEDEIKDRLKEINEIAAKKIPLWVRMNKRLGIFIIRLWTR